MGAVSGHLWGRCRDAGNLQHAGVPVPSQTPGVTPALATLIPKSHVISQRVLSFRSHACPEVNVLLVESRGQGEGWNHSFVEMVLETRTVTPTNKSHHRTLMWQRIYRFQKVSGNPGVSPCLSLLPKCFPKQRFQSLYTTGLLKLCPGASAWRSAWHPLVILLKWALAAPTRVCNRLAACLLGASRPLLSPEWKEKQGSSRVPRAPAGLPPTSGALTGCGKPRPRADPGALAAARVLRALRSNVPLRWGSWRLSTSSAQLEAFTPAGFAVKCRKWKQKPSVPQLFDNAQHGSGF